MDELGTQFRYGQVLKEIEKKDGQLICTFQNKAGTEVTGYGHFDTVLVAIGREMETQFLNLESIGVDMDKSG